MFARPERPLRVCIALAAAPERPEQSASSADSPIVLFVARSVGRGQLQKGLMSIEKILYYISAARAGSVAVRQARRRASTVGAQRRRAV